MSLANIIAVERFFDRTGVAFLMALGLALGLALAGGVALFGV